MSKGVLWNRLFPVGRKRTPHENGGRVEAGCRPETSPAGGDCIPSEDVGAGRAISGNYAPRVAEGLHLGSVEGDWWFTREMRGGNRGYPSYVRNDRGRPKGADRGSNGSSAGNPRRRNHRRDLQPAEDGQGSGGLAGEPPRRTRRSQVVQITRVPELQERRRLPRRPPGEELPHAAGDGPRHEVRSRGVGGRMEVGRG